MIFKISVSRYRHVYPIFFVSEEVVRLLVMFRDRGEDPLDSSITSARFLNRSEEIGEII